MLEMSNRARLVAADTQTYLHEVLGLGSNLRPCPGENLPVYLARTYDLACGTILNLDFVFAIDVSDQESAPTTIAKHLATISGVFGQQVVYIRESLEAHHRQRLIARKIPFIVPHAQMYLPPLGVDLREVVRRRPLGPPGTFSPATQAVLLHALLRRGSHDLRAADVAETLGYSEMSASRAFRDLEAAKFVTRPTTGRSRPARLASTKAEVWKQAQPFLASPVSKRFVTYAPQVPGALEAGLTALSRVSWLAAPRQQTVALGTKAWAKVRHEVRLQPAAPTAFDEPDRLRVEVWAYPPEVISKGPAVDTLSLSLSLRDGDDERVEAALEQALESMAW